MGGSRVDPARNSAFWARSGLENRDYRVPGRAHDRPMGYGIPGKPAVFQAKFIFQEKLAHPGLDRVRVVYFRKNPGLSRVRVTFSKNPGPGSEIAGLTRSHSWPGQKTRGFKIGHPCFEVL